MLHAITVDVEDYFHTEAMSSTVTRDQWDSMPSRVVDNTRHLLELFARFDVKGTFFFLGWVAKKFPFLVKETASAGHEIGCHSYWHRAVFRVSREEFAADTRDAVAAIADACGRRPIGYRAPSFSIVTGTEWAWDVLVELGFSYDSSVNPIRHGFYGNSKAPRKPYRVANGELLEIPIATIRHLGNNLPCGGGAYLRFFPLSYFKFALTHLNRNDMSAMLYLHPWEIDAKQPRLAAPLKSRLRQYTGLGKMERRLERLLTEYRFGPAERVFATGLRRQHQVPEQVGQI